MLIQFFYLFIPTKYIFYDPKIVLFMHTLQLHSGPPHSLITFFKVWIFSISLKSFGKAFQICGPSDKRLFELKVTWLGLWWISSFGFLVGLVVCFSLKISCIKGGFLYEIIINNQIRNKDLVPTHAKRRATHYRYTVWRIKIDAWLHIMMIIHLTIPAPFRLIS